MKTPFTLRLLTLLVSGFILLQACETDLPGAPEDVTYATDVSPIMSNYCLTCHSGAAPSAGLNLDNYANVRSVCELGSLVNRTNDTQNPMPPSGLMNEENRQKLIDWVKGGFQE